MATYVEMGLKRLFEMIWIFSSSSSMNDDNNDAGGREQ